MCTRDTWRIRCAIQAFLSVLKILGWHNGPRSCSLNHKTHTVCQDSVLWPLLSPSLFRCLLSQQEKFCSEIADCKETLLWPLLFTAFSLYKLLLIMKEISWPLPAFWAIPQAHQYPVCSACFSLVHFCVRVFCFLYVCVLLSGCKCMVNATGWKEIHIYLLMWWVLCLQRGFHIKNLTSWHFWMTLKCNQWSWFYMFSLINLPMVAWHIILTLYQHHKRHFDAEIPKVLSHPHSESKLTCQQWKTELQVLSWHKKTGSKRG